MYDKTGVVPSWTFQLTRCRVDQHSSRVRSLMFPMGPAPPMPAAEARDY